jgi:hypothetical protein
VTVIGSPRRRITIGSKLWLECDARLWGLGLLLVSKWIQLSNAFPTLPFLWILAQWPFLP